MIMIHPPVGIEAGVPGRRTASNLPVWMSGDCSQWLGWEGKAGCFRFIPRKMVDSMDKKNLVSRLLVALTVVVAVFLFFGCNAEDLVVPPAPQDPLTNSAQVIFLHHSTGNVIWNGGVADAIDAYNAASGKDYHVTELAYPNTPYPWENYPYDYWHLWVQDGGKAAEEGVPTLESFVDGYDVVVFKHCFPVSAISADTGNPDISSSARRLENYKLQYEALKNRLHQFPDTRFIVWTGAALVASASSPEMGQRSREFFTWVKNEWDEPGDNIFIWDFYELETEGGDFLKDDYSAGGGDSHPNATFAQVVAPLFAERIVEVIEGRAD